ncbi:unnamed protein product, partial [Didymodactylos carnosus]
MSFSSTIIRNYFINLPDLIILELFNYFTPINCVQLFFDIDERWNQLLHEKKYLTHLDYLSSRYICPSTYTYFCRRVLPKIYHQIVSLSINENITCAKLKTFHFIKMKNLKYLKLSFIYQPEDLDQCLQQLEKNHIELGIQFMNRCKKEFFQILLKHIDNFEAFHCSDALNLKFNRQLLNLKRLTIWLECLSDLCTLFTYLPLLEYLSIQGTSR